MAETGTKKRRLRKLCDIPKHLPTLKQRNRLLQLLKKHRIERVHSRKEVVEMGSKLGAKMGAKATKTPREEKEGKVKKVEKKGKKEEGEKKTEKEEEERKDEVEPISYAHIRSLNPNKKSELEQLVKLAKKSRARGFWRDERIITGDVRDPVHTSCSHATLIFEIVRRSSLAATTWEQCKKEWRGEETYGIKGWSCVGGKMTKPLFDGSPVAWLDDPTDDSWEEGQCVCLQTRPTGVRAIKYRYRAKNMITGEVVTLGSTCISKWGGEFAKKAQDNYRWAVHTVKTEPVGRKFCFV